MTRAKGPVKVIHRRKNGEVFDPAELVITREMCPQIYALLERQPISKQAAATVEVPVVVPKLPETESIKQIYEWLDCDIKKNGTVIHYICEEGQSKAVYAFKVTGMGTSMFYVSYEASGKIRLSDFPTRISDRNFTVDEIIQYCNLMFS